MCLHLLDRSFGCHCLQSFSCQCFRFLEKDIFNLKCKDDQKWLSETKHLQRHRPKPFHFKM